jgi:hypothetical protein
MAFIGAPEYEPNHVNLLIKITRLLSGVMQGKTNNTGSVTLTANSATTTLTLSSGQVGNDTVVLFMPTTANAATEFGAGALYVSARSVANSTFTITHANNAQADRIFRYVLIG